MAISTFCIPILSEAKPVTSYCAVLVYMPRGRERRHYSVEPGVIVCSAMVSSDGLFLLPSSLL